MEDTLKVITSRTKNQDPGKLFGRTDVFTTETLMTIIFTGLESTSPKMVLSLKIRVGIKVRDFFSITVQTPEVYIFFSFITLDIRYPTKGGH